jgi:hypothetical protein
MDRLFRGMSARLRDLPSSLALWATNRPALAGRLDAHYHATQRRHQPRLPRPEGVDADIVAGLWRDGVYVTTLDALGMGESAPMLRAARQLARAYAAIAHREVQDGTYFNTVPPGAMMYRPEIFAWGLQDRLLDIIEAYLAVPVAYDGAQIIYTVADSREVATRLWHRDREDRRMVKVSVYCNDVGPGDGPFQIVRRFNEHAHDGPFSYPSLDDAGLARHHDGRDAWDVVSCEGRAGTVIFADTARNFHRGEPASARDRKAVFFSYFSRTPRHPFYCERSGLTRAQLGTIAARMPERQRDAILWRQSLPAIARLIPPARISMRRDPASHTTAALLWNEPVIHSHCPD